MTLLSYGGHRLLEASDGAEAFDIARTEHPDLIITDILMPTMDGLELATRLHADPACANIVIVFYTATYLEREAHALAKAANVRYVLVKPSEPQVILDTVNAALGLTTPSPVVPPSNALKHGPLDRLANLFVLTEAQLRVVNEQMAAIVELGIELGSERNPARLLENFCHAARRIIGAKYAAVAVLDDSGQKMIHFYTSGLDAETIARIGSLPVGKGLLGHLLTERRPLRVRDIAADPRSVGFPPHHPPMRSFLGVPIASAMQVYGRLYLTDKPGEEEFNANDERIATTLAAQIAVAYENARLYDEIQRRAADLEQEVVQRRRAESRLRQSETKYRALAEQIPAVTYRAAYDQVGSLLYISPQIEAMLGFPPADWLNEPNLTLERLHPDDRERVVAEKTRSQATGEPFYADYRMIARDGRTVWVRDESIVVRDDAAQLLFVQGVMLDITERKQSEAHIAHLNRVLRALREVNLLIMRQKDPARLLDQACEILIQTRDYRFAWIRLVKPGYSQFITAARAGQDAQLLDRMVQMDESASGSDASEWDLTGKAVRTREPVVMRLPEDPLAGEAGEHSVASAPMTHADRVFGAVTVCAVTANVFDEEELSLLVELAGDLAFALQGIEDDTARRQAEKALHENAKRFQALIENIGDAISLVKPDGTIVHASASTTRVLGYTPEEYVGRNAFEMIHPDDSESNMRLFAHLLQNPAANLTSQFRYRHKDGSWRWIEAVGTNLLSEPSVQAIVVNYRDISERKRRERELETIVTVAAALRAAPTRGDMLPVILNEVIRLLGVEGAALVMHDPSTGENVISLARGKWEEATGKRLAPGSGVSAHVIATGEPYLNNDVRSDPRMALSDIMVRLRAGACAPLAEQGEVIGALWIGSQTDISRDTLQLLTAMADISANALHRARVLETLEERVVERTQELAKANERLKELDQLKSKFVSDVSHELRTPVTNLKLYVDLLEQGKPEKQTQYVKTLGEQANRLAALVEDILNLSRLEMGAKAVQFEPIDLNALVKQLVDVHRPAATLAGLRLTFAPDLDLPSVWGEPNQLAQVITNLVANAINYTPAGEVAVKTRLKDGLACLEVRDTGMGIQPEDLSHIFERFYRGKQRTGRLTISGTGLGLAIVKEIVDLHGGRIEVESEPDAGSTFRVYLPLADSGR